MVAVVDEKLVFGRGQVLTSTQASKNFGEARRRARKEPQFVSDRNNGIDTVIVSFDEFEAMAVELERLREERLYAIAAARLARGDADPNRAGRWDAMPLMPWWPPRLPIPSPTRSCSSECRQIRGRVL